MPGEEEYAAGGFAAVDGAPMGGSVSESLGRLWNNISGTTANNKMAIAEAEKARQFSSAEAAANRSWQEYMSNTAYQRAVADMKSAGINPMMAANQGGAFTPSGAVGSPSAARATASGNGGIAGVIGRIAAIAVSRGLAAKFMSSAAKAGSVSDVVRNVSDDVVSASRASRISPEMRKIINYPLWD